MPDYKNGKIYKITCETGKIYIGSTTQKYLASRFTCHKYKHSGRRCLTKDFIKPKIELIESYPCETKQQLLWKEREWIENTDCVNKVVPIVTKEEKLSRFKEYNRDWYQKNKEKQNNYDKVYYAKNKEKINQRISKKITCECGSTISRGNLSHHIKSKKHLNYVSSKQ